MCNKQKASAGRTSAVVTIALTSPRCSAAISSNLPTILPSSTRRLLADSRPAKAGQMGEWRESISSGCSDAAAKTLQAWW